jgi:DNA invertase Pin-like site-specific DNA recombinase
MAIPQRPRTFISYLRVSTQQQGRSGLGLEAQREHVARYLANIGVAGIAAEFVEIETGKRSDRPELASALAQCRATGAVLVVAKLDRLSRDVDFLRKCVADTGPAGILFCDLPDLPPGAAGKLMLTIMASIAEFEAGRISERTKAALAAWKVRNPHRKLGNPKLKPGDARATAKARASRSRKADEKATMLMQFIEAAHRAGAVSLREIGDAMEARGIRAPLGGERWHPATVLAVMRRVERLRMPMAA